MKWMQLAAICPSKAFEISLDSRIFLKCVQAIVIAVNGIFPTAIICIGQDNESLPKFLRKIPYRCVSVGCRFSCIKQRTEVTEIVAQQQNDIVVDGHLLAAGFFAGYILS